MYEQWNYLITKKSGQNLWEIVEVHSPQARLSHAYNWHHKHHSHEWSCFSHFFLLFICVVRDLEQAPKEPM